MTAAAATELWRMSATELARRIRTRQVSSAEVVEAHLRRIEAVNPAINAVVIVLTQGFKALAGAYPSRDAPIVERMKAAGAIPMGRTNLPSGAVRWHTESELWGATINPWNRARTPGASSAGEAAAIAASMSPLGLGSDGLGSLRHPAQCCGIASRCCGRGASSRRSTR